MVSAVRLLAVTMTEPLELGLEHITLESPMEELFFVALCMRANELGVSYAWDQFGPNRQDYYCHLAITPQHRVSRYRVDFLLDYTDDYAISLGKNGQSQLVVEIDGHDFHEKTRVQAARDKERDRILQEAGFTVFHFTGSELWAKPMERASQCLKYLEKRVWQ